MTLKSLLMAIKASDTEEKEIDLELTNNLNETNLSRIFQHLNNPDMCMVTITSDRKDITDKAESEKRRKELEQTIKKKKFGYTKVIGGWHENQNGKKISVTEKSFLVFFKSNELEKAKVVFTELCDKFNQDGYLLVVGGNAKVIDKTGNIFKELGKWHPKKLDDYTKLRNGRIFSYDSIKIEEAFSTFNTSIEKIMTQHNELVTLAALKNNTTFEEEFEKCKDYKYAEKIANYFNGVQK